MSPGRLGAASWHPEGGWPGPVFCSQRSLALKRSIRLPKELVSPTETALTAGMTHCAVKPSQTLRLKRGRVSPGLPSGSRASRSGGPECPLTLTSPGSQRHAHGPLSPQAPSLRWQTEGTREGFGADPTGSPLSTGDPGQMNYLTSTGLNLLDCRSQTVIPA